MMITSSSGKAGASANAVRKRIQTLPGRFLTGSADGLAAEWELRIGDEEFAVAVVERTCHVRQGPALNPSAVITTDPTTWLSLDAGAIASIQAYLDRRLAVRGNLDLAVRLQTMFRPYRRKRRASDVEQVDLPVDGVRISSYLAGEGEPLVLLHGLGASKISWLPLLPTLAERYRLVVPDLPGHGESEKPRSDYSPRFYARIVRLLMDATGVERAVVVGNSMGGRVGLELALRSPKRVAGLALLDPAMPGLRWRYVMGFTRVFPTELGVVSFPLRRRWMEAALRRLFGDPSRLPPEAIANAAEEFIRVYADPAARLAFLTSLRQVVTERPGPFWASMRRVRAPSLVVFGERDRLVPPRLGVRLAEQLPDAEFIVLPTVGHVPQFEATDEILATLLPFLARVAGGAGRRSPKGRSNGAGQDPASARSKAR